MGILWLTEVVSWYYLPFCSTLWVSWVPPWPHPAVGGVLVVVFLCNTYSTILPSSFTSCLHISPPPGKISSILSTVYRACTCFSSLFAAEGTLRWVTWWKVAQVTSLAHSDTLLFFSPSWTRAILFITSPFSRSEHYWSLALPQVFHCGRPKLIQKGRQGEVTSTTGEASEMAANPLVS